MQGETTGEENSQRSLVFTDLKYSGSYGRENIKRCLTMQTRIQGAKLVCNGCKNKTVQLSRESLERGRGGEEIFKCIDFPRARHKRI